MTLIWNLDSTYTPIARSRCRLVRSFPHLPVALSPGLIIHSISVPIAWIWIPNSTHAPIAWSRCRLVRSCPHLVIALIALTNLPSKSVPISWSRCRLDRNYNFHTCPNLLVALSPWPFDELQYKYRIGCLLTNIYLHKLSSGQITAIPVFIVLNSIIDILTNFFRYYRIKTPLSLPKSRMKSINGLKISNQIGWRWILIWKSKQRKLPWYQVLHLFTGWRFVTSLSVLAEASI